MKPPDEVELDIEKQQWQDMAKRAWVCILASPLVWFSIGIWSDIYQTQTTLFLINAAIILVAASVRLYWIQYRKSQRYLSNIKTLSRLVLLNGLHWGGLYAWLIHGISSSVADQFTSIIILSCFALSASYTYNQFKSLGLTLPAIIILPSSIISVIVQTDNYKVFLILALIMILHCYLLSKSAKASYVSSLQQRYSLATNAQKAQKLSRTDYLTELPNRLDFVEKYEALWQNSIQSKQNISLIFANVNFLKDINSMHGYAVGDKLIQQIAKTLNNVVKPPNILARYGGDEFAIALPETDASGAAELGNLIQSSIRDISFVHQNNTIPCSCALGLTTIKPGPDDDPAIFLEDARRSLHQANIQSNTSWTKLSALKVFDMHSSE